MSGVMKIGMSEAQTTSLNFVTCIPGSLQQHIMNLMETMVSSRMFPHDHRVPRLKARSWTTHTDADVRECWTDTVFDINECFLSLFEDIGTL